MTKRFPIRVFAIFADTFPALMGLALMALPFSGALVGAATGASYCPQGWQWVQTACQAVGGWFGWIAGTALLPVGLILAPVVVFCLNILLGAMLIIFLIYSGTFSGKIVLMGSIGETVPFLGFLPFFTGMTWACVRSADKKEKQKKIAEEGSLKQDNESNYPAIVPTPATMPLYSAPVFQTQKTDNDNLRSDNDNKKPMGASREKMELKSPDIRPPQKTAIAAAILLVLCFGGTASTAHAQVAPEPVRFTIAPETPGPNELVVIEAEGIGGLLGDAQITWQLDGKTALSGVGEEKFSFRTGALGSQQKVTVTISPKGQNPVTRQFIFAPSLINLIWEADTTTPFFYRGASLYSAGSGVKVVVFPHVIINGTEASGNALSYQWSLNGEPVPAQSGIGRTVLTFDGDQLNSQETVSVDVLLSDIKVGHGEVVIPASSPQLLLYERDPLRGILYESALPAGISLLSREISLRAEPYYFSTASLKSGVLAYSWLLDGEDTAGPDASLGFLTLRQTGESSGGAQLSVTLQNNDFSKLGQSASAAVQILFGAQSSVGNTSLGAAVANSFKFIAQAVPNWQQINNSSQAQFGSAPGQPLTYKPLEPLPGVFTGGCPNVSTLINGLLKILISVGAIFAVLTLVVGGVMYMVSDIVNVKARAKERMWAAIWGIILICIAWLILYTINPQLVSFNNNLFKDSCGSTGVSVSPTTAGSGTGSNSTPNSINYINGNSGPSTGTATGDQMRAVAESLGLKNAMGSDVYVLLDPNALSASQVNDLENKYRDFCERSGIIYTTTGGILHYTMQRAPGDIFGAPGQTALVCTGDS